MLKTDRQVITENRADSVRSLYNRYAAMLLGYIAEIVGDTKVAQEHLVTIFTELSHQYDGQEYQGPGNWAELRRLVRGKMVLMTSSIALPSSYPAEQAHSGNTAGALTQEQQMIFSAIYHHGKSVSILSTELNKTEEFIRKTLKEAFARLRYSG